MLEKVIEIPNPSMDSEGLSLVTVFLIAGIVVPAATFSPLDKISSASAGRQSVPAPLQVST